MTPRTAIPALLLAGLVAAQDRTFSFPFAQTPEQIAAQEQEQRDLQRALTEAQTSPIDLVRALEAHLEKYPNSEKRGELEGVLARASIDNKDTVRIARYGQKVLETTPEDILMLDRVAAALLAMGGEENAQKALRYARYFEDLIESAGVAEGKDAAQRQEERERARGRVILYQARARTMLGFPDEAVRLAARSFDVYPNEESAREWANALLRVGREEEALAHLAEAFAIPDSHTTDQQRLDDRLQAGVLYTKLRGSEKGLGDYFLEAYDRASTIVETRRRKVLALDPNSLLADPMDFTVTGLDGKKLKLASLKGKVVVLDFWATWCAPCKVQHPLYEEVKGVFSDRDDVVFLALDTDDDRSLVAPFLAEQKWDKAVYFDDGLARLLQVTSIPTTILIGKEGRIGSRMNGFLPETFVAQLTERIRLLLGPPGGK
jgi:thiol-disulfide isomerase/thioredoxin